MKTGVVTFSTGSASLIVGTDGRRHLAGLDLEVGQRVTFTPVATRGSGLSVARDIRLV